MKRIIIQLSILMTILSLTTGGCIKKRVVPPPPPVELACPVEEVRVCGDPHRDLEVGGWAMKCDQYGRAVVLLTCAIDSCCLSRLELAKAYNWRGLALAKSGNCQAAICDFTEAIRLFPSYDAAYQNRSYAYMKCGSMALASRDKTRYEKMVTMAKAKGLQPFKGSWPKGCPPGGGLICVTPEPPEPIKVEPEERRETRCPQCWIARPIPTGPQP